MSTDHRAPSTPASGDPARAASAWRRLLSWVIAFEEAMDTTTDDIQDRRILALERELATLKACARGSPARDDPSG